MATTKKSKLNFENSPKLWEQIKRAKRILLACHIGADPDSIVSCLTFKEALAQFGKVSDVVLSDPISKFYKHLDPENYIKLVDFKKFDFKKYDTFVVLDVGDIKRFGITSTLPKEIVIVNIDHHADNKIVGLKINDTSYSSTSEMVFGVFEDWGVELTRKILDLILIGVVSDSDGFKYSVSPRLFENVSKLLRLGADYEKAAEMLWRNYSPDQLRFWSKMLGNVEVEKDLKFVYAALDYEEYKKFKDLIHPTRSVADMFLRSITGTNFGVTILEYEKNNLKISVRSRQVGFATLPLVQALGGGGHRDGGGAVMKDTGFEEGVAKVLKIARQFALGK